jgi:hypothetical protein
MPIVWAILPDISPELLSTLLNAVCLQAAHGIERHRTHCHEEGRALPARVGPQLGGRKLLEIVAIFGHIPWSATTRPASRPTRPCCDAGTIFPEIFVRPSGRRH